MYLPVHWITGSQGAGGRPKFRSFGRGRGKGSGGEGRGGKGRCGGKRGRGGSKGRGGCNGRGKGCARVVPASAGGLALEPAAVWAETRPWVSLRA